MAEPDKEVKDALAENGEYEEEDDVEDDPEIQRMKREIEELERENQALAEKGGEAPGAAAPGTPGDGALGSMTKTYSPTGPPGSAPPAAVDENSVHVGNLPETVGPDDLQEHFKACGTIKRITVLCDKWTGRPKGYAYIEFMEPKGVELALGFHETSLKGNIIQVTPKRHNVPQFMLRGRGRGGGYRGGYRGRGGPPYRGRGGYPGFRGRYAPY